MQDDPQSDQRRSFCLPEEATEVVKIPGEESIERVAGSGARPSSATSQALPPEHVEDFYYEGELVVFTADYHLRRGYCCQSGCRHCPFPLDQSAQSNILRE